jgi:chromosome segregation ATPase
MASFTLSLVELIVLLVGAIILGLTIHFFITSRKNLRIPKDTNKPDIARNEWKLKYFNDMELKDREITTLTNRVNISEENAERFAMDLEELNKAYRVMKSSAGRESAGDDTITEALKEEIDELHEQLASVQQIHQQKLDQKDEQIVNLQEKADELQDRLGIALENNDSNDSNNNKNNDEAAIHVLNEQNEHLRSQLLSMSREAHYEQQSAQQLIEDLRKQITQFQAELAGARSQAGEEQGRNDDYLDRLIEAKQSLLQHNQQINDLLGNIDVIREKEEMQQEMARTNEELSGQLHDMRQLLESRESELHSIRQKESLSKEMSSMLEQAYSEFNILQEKISRLEAQLTSSRLHSLDYEDLKESHLKLSGDVERYRQKSQALTSDNLNLQQELNLVEDKLKEANLQRQQLQKKVSYLEEINHDLQSVSDANRRLEGQLKRIGELESMLNVVAEERDQLMQKQQASHQPPPFA